jgi:AraC-like DNA-binding protein
MVPPGLPHLSDWYADCGGHRSRCYLGALTFSCASRHRSEIEACTPASLSYGCDKGAFLTVRAKRLTNDVRQLRCVTGAMENNKRPIYTTPAESARNVIVAASPRVHSRALCDAVGLEPNCLSDRNARVPVSRLIELYEVAAKLTGDSDFGLHVGVRTSLRTFGVLGYILMNSTTIGLALERLVRFFPIWTNGTRFALCFEGSAVHVVWEYMDSRGADCRHDCEMTLLTTTKACLFPGGAVPREVRFQHSSPRNICEHRRLFRAPVHFGMKQNEVIFDNASLSANVRGADPTLSDLLIDHAENMLATAPSKGSQIDRVRAALRWALGKGNPELMPVSRSMGIGVRTLQRELKACGTSFRGLLAEVRQELAQQHLRDPEMSIAEIAYRLGYTQPSEFHRAFRSATGMTPKKYRSSIGHF